MPRTISTRSDNIVPVNWLPALRVSWLLLFLVLLSLFLAGISYYYVELATPCQGDCFVLVLTPEEAAILAEAGMSLPAYAAVMLGMELGFALLFILLATLIFWLRSDTWVGLVISAAFLFLGTVFFGESIRALTRAYPDLAYLTKLTDILTALSVFSFILIFLIFPDGRFIPRWTKYLAWVMGGIIVIDGLLDLGGVQATSASLLTVLLAVVSAIVGIAGQIYRYVRISTAVQRQQTKWVILGLASMLTVVMFWIWFGEIFPLPPGPERIAFNFSLIGQFLVASLFPFSVVISILHYRLWDIDIIIRKTLVYGVLTALLALVYFGSVVVLQQLFGSVTGVEQSPAAIVISTLAIAALFTPLRGRVQAAIDRRFYRQKYDAQQVLARFAQTARDETDLESLQRELVRVVQETMQPERVSVWIISDKDSIRNDSRNV